MASSMIGGLVASGHSASHIAVCDPSAAQRTMLETRFGVHTSEDASAVQGADTVVLAVKPHIVEQACATVAPMLGGDAVVISIAAGTLISNIDHWLGGNQCIVRCMPNTPALCGEGASVLYAGAAVSATARSLAQYVLESAGRVWWVDSEPELDAVTALSGSGPAYGFLLIEAMADTGQKLGLERELAEQLAVQTLLGAATMASEDSRDPATLRDAVTSKGGTTAAALRLFEECGFRDLVERAMTAARDRAQELAQPTGDTP